MSNKSCLTCQYFKSFRDDYIDDMEPDDLGFCLNSQSSYHHFGGAGYDAVCEYHKPIKP